MVGRFDFKGVRHDLCQASEHVFMHHPADVCIWFYPSTDAFSPILRLEYCFTVLSSPFVFFFVFDKEMRLDIGQHF